jgi:predicted transcriptional regulator
MPDTYKELRECLQLQTEIQAKRDELTRRFKAIIEAERAAGNQGGIVTMIDGSVYELRRRDLKDVRESIDSARKFGGFYHQYALVLLGKPISGQE